MSDVKFTPGPWGVCKNRFGKISSLRGVDICSLLKYGKKDGEAKANAHLIAAAPDMYAALVHIREIIAEGAKVGFNPTNGEWAEKLFLSQQKSSRAVKKARGENHD